MPARRKDPGRLADRRSSRISGRVVDLDGERTRKRRDELRAQVPAGLLKANEQAWERFWDSELSALVMPEDMPALDRLWRWYADRDRLWRQYSKEHFVFGSKPPQIVASPAFRMILAVEASILKHEELFGIGPRHRSRLGVSFGKAALTLDDVNAKIDADMAAAQARGESHSDPRDLPDPFHREGS